METVNNSEAGLSAEVYEHTATIDSVDFSRTVYRAMQDVHAAVRYMRAHAAELRIDPDKIYLLGNSAGGMMGLENIYGLKKSDYPSYIEDEEKGYVNMGELDEYGEKGFDGVANGVVALWGAVHDKNIVNNSKVPVFLAHGDSDYVMPFAEGHAVSDVKRMIGDKNLEYLQSLDFRIHTPTLYGSYIVDSILTANKVYHEFYAPRGLELKHEFYNTTRTDSAGNEIIYADSVRQKAFAFLYKLAAGLIPSEGEHTTPMPFATIARASRIEMGENNLSFRVTRGQNVAYAVFGLKGERKLMGRASEGETVDLNGLESGVYYLRVQGDVARRIGIAK